jgi:uncharacterized membrane protein required for colicin V production
MTWLDLITIALFVLFGVVETKRGFFPAAIDLLAGVLGLTIAKAWAPLLTSALGSESTAFLVLFAVVVVLTGVGSSLVDAYTKWDIGAFDSALAGVLGVVVGLVLAHGAYHAATVAGGHVANVAAGSLLTPEVYELRTAHAIGDMLRGLGGGQTVVEKVREQQK